jgi:hypothetical protein
MLRICGPSLFFVFTLLLSGLGCASGNPNEGLLVAPSLPVVRVGEPLTLSTQPLEELSAEPEWEIQELHGGGFTQSRGFSITYVAPPSAGTYHLVARAPRPNGSPLKQVVEVRVLADPRIEPATTTLPSGGTRSFGVRMRGLARNTVTWSVEEPEGGTITPEGQYTAPSRPGTYHVIATSTVDPEVSISATVRVD